MQNLTRSSCCNPFSFAFDELPKSQRDGLALNATKGEPVRLSVGKAVHARQGGIEGPSPGTRRAHLRRRPKGRVARTIVAITTGTAAAGRLSGEARGVGGGREG
jgi:hypothetical protein